MQSRPKRSKKKSFRRLPGICSRLREASMAAEPIPDAGLLFDGDEDYHFILDGCPTPRCAARPRPVHLPSVHAQRPPRSPRCTTIEELWRYAYRGGAQGERARRA
jgi:hypothetical protein